MTKSLKLLIEDGIVHKFFSYVPISKDVSYRGSFQFTETIEGHYFWSCRMENEKISRSDLLYLQENYPELCI